MSENCASFALPLRSLSLYISVPELHVLVTGLLGLPDGKSLKTLIESPAFQSIYKQYASKRKAPWSLHTIKTAKFFDPIEQQGARKGYGTIGDTISTSGWTANHWVAHYIVMLQSANGSLLQALLIIWCLNVWHCIELATRDFP
jgi:hypothetical protein